MVGLLEAHQISKMVTQRSKSIKHTRVAATGRDPCVLIPETKTKHILLTFDVAELWGLHTYCLSIHSLTTPFFPSNQAKQICRVSLSMHSTRGRKFKYKIVEKRVKYWPGQQQIQSPILSMRKLPFTLSRHCIITYNTSKAINIFSIQMHQLSSCYIRLILILNHLSG